VQNDAQAQLGHRRLKSERGPNRVAGEDLATGFEIYQVDSFDAHGVYFRYEGLKK
jgi:hypothetical protein